jgi:hypothetical protein
MLGAKVETLWHTAVLFWECIVIISSNARIFASIRSHKRGVVVVFELKAATPEKSVDYC